MSITKYDEEKTLRQMFEDGYEIGIKKGILEILIELVKDGTIPLAEAAKRADMSISEFEEKIKSNA